jgi:hypothetical protein
MRLEFSRMEVWYCSGFGADLGQYILAGCSS